MTSLHGLLHPQLCKQAKIMKENDGKSCYFQESSNNLVVPLLILKCSLNNKQPRRRPKTLKYSLEEQRLGTPGESSCRCVYQKSYLHAKRQDLINSVIAVKLMSML